MDRNTLLAAHRRRARNATTVFQPAARRRALSQAARDAEREARDIESTWYEEQTAWQAQLDREWARLRSNDPDTVLNVLHQAFSDNEAAAAAVGVEDSQVSVVVVVPPPGVLPERRPTLTPAGNLSLKKLTKRDLSDLYKTLVFGHMLATIKEAFAEAPGVTSIKAVAVRPTPQSNLEPRTEVLVAAEFQRARVQGFVWDGTDSLRALEELADATVFVTRGVTRELVPVNLDAEPQLTELSEAIHFADLLGG